MGIMDFFIQRNKNTANVAKERLRIIAKAIHGPVDLAAEVISLGGRNRDRIDKRDLYEQYGVKEYWLIDPQLRAIEIYRRQRFRLTARLGVGDLITSTLLPGFTCSVREILE